ncbi:unnamed protein product [Notodromas monacha]|uniref:Peptidase M24 C-terminal domain-containing protein n=1 Tax=Notodromas monacha TaxID=399045 RepID=A0A7R9GHZ4_9CRUS|nr:unnamed protein product [Notodromas monacha]CAG0921289.1 unnamed protein product [Notodromas monacha]
MELFRNFCGFHLLALTVLASAEDFSTEVKRRRPKCHKFADGQGNISDRLNSTMMLEDLRQYLKHYYTAYVVTWTNEHLMEFTGKCENRLAAISGFPGFGYAVITGDRATLWTKKMLVPLADRTVDCNWQILELDSKVQLSLPQYLDKFVKRKGERQNVVVVDPTLISATTFLDWRSQLEKVNIYFGGMRENLVDRVWRNRAPCARQSVVYHLPTAMTGKPWVEKVKELRKDLRDQLVDGILVTSPDEVAWLLNLRGKDFSYQELFRSYVYLNQSSVHLFANGLEKEAHRALKTRTCDQGKNCVILHDYAKFDTFLKETVPRTSERILLPKQYGTSFGVSTYIYETIDQQMGGRFKFTKSPIQDMKAVKTTVEIHAMKEANFKDSVAFVSFMAQLEQKVKIGLSVSEHVAINMLEKKREDQKWYVGNSVHPRSYYGINTADPTYSASLKQSLPIGNNSLYVIHSGAHYRGFQPLTFVPFEPSLIDWKFLSFEQVAWLNKYNDDTRRFIGDQLLANKQTLAHEWLVEKTKMASSENCILAAIQSSARSGMSLSLSLADAMSVSATREKMLGSSVDGGGWCGKKRKRRDGQRVVRESCFLTATGNRISQPCVGRVREMAGIRERRVRV